MGVLQKVVALAPDPIQEFLSAAYRRYSRLRLEARVWYHYDRKHEASLEPLRLLWLDPHRIDYRISEPWSLMNLLDLPGAVLGDDWDRHRLPVESHPYHEFLTAHFEEGVRWQETEFVQQKIREVECGDEVVHGPQSAWHGCRTRDEIYERCREIDRLYESMRQHSHLTQRELRDFDTPPLGGPPTFAIPERNEVEVAVDRNGEFLFVDGGHRFFLSRILDLERIPVHVVVRHSEWQRVRNEIRNARSRSALRDEYERYLGHPDVRDAEPPPEGRRVEHST